MYKLLLYSMPDVLAYRVPAFDIEINPCAIYILCMYYVYCILYIPGCLLYKGTIEPTFMSIKTFMILW